MPGEGVPGEGPVNSVERQPPALVWTHERVAVAVFLAALLIYFSNSASSPPTETDSAPNAFLPGSVLGDGDLAFSPFEAPSLFIWSAKGANGENVRIYVP